MPAEPAAGPPSVAAGLVVAMQANYCMVLLDEPGPAARSHLLCTRRTRLAKSGQAICVGDRVRVEGIDWPAGRAAVAAVQPRGSRLERPAVANVARVVVVASLAEPALDLLQLTRFLITAEACGPPVLLVLSKADLLPAAEVETWCRRTRSWGYEPLPLATARGDGLQRVREQLGQPGISVLCGPSGVGKSSLLNALVPDLDLRVGAVSGRLQRGRHTTRHVELFALEPAALVADTPGFNRPELPRCPEALGALFPEVRAQLVRRGACRFSNCLHRGEPGCSVGTAWERSPLYLQCLREIEQEQERRRTDPEPGTPVRFRPSPSRRTGRQEAARELDGQDPG